MSKSKRFERWKDSYCKVKDNQEDRVLSWEDIIVNLNTQQDTIELLCEEGICFASMFRDEIKENEELKKQLKEFKIENDKIIKENEELKKQYDKIKLKGCNLLDFYEEKLLNVFETEDYQNIQAVRDEIWLVKFILYELGVLNGMDD